LVVFGFTPVDAEDGTPLRPKARGFEGQAQSIEHGVHRVDHGERGGE